jgi:hypothetical protein
MKWKFSSKQLKQIGREHDQVYKRFASINQEKVNMDQDTPLVGALLVK